MQSIGQKDALCIMYQSNKVVVDIANNTILQPFQNGCCSCDDGKIFRRGCWHIIILTYAPFCVVVRARTKTHKIDLFDCVLVVFGQGFSEKAVEM